MKFLFSNSTNFDINEEIIKNIKNSIVETLKYENFTQNVEISFSIVDNAEIKNINKKFRNIDKVTDVLSFPLLTDFNIDFKNITTPILLGDIIISIEKAKEQAENYNHSLLREICFLTVHSMLHLLGYDHMIQEEEEIMFKKQKEILNILNIIR